MGDRLGIPSAVDFFNFFFCFVFILFLTEMLNLFIVLFIYFAENSRAYSLNMGHVR